MRCFSFLFCLSCLILLNPGWNIHSFSPCVQLRWVLIVFMFSVAANWKLGQILSWAKRRIGVPSRAFRWFGSRKVLICTPLIRASVWKEKRKGSAPYPPMPFPSRSSTSLAFMRALDVLACPSWSRAPLEVSTPFSLSRALCIHAQARLSPSFLSSARRCSKAVCSGRGHHF